MIPQDKSLFVIMPFKETFNSVYSIIKSVSRSCGYRCWRADERCVSGNVVRQIIDDIYSADAIVSDLTGRNPNVFYETAIAHERKKENKVILIAQKDRDVPFDLQALRYLKYSIKTQESKRNFKTKLKSFLIEAGKEASDPLFEVIDGANERVRRITAELNTVMEKKRSKISSITICSQSGHSVLAMSKKEVDSSSNSEQRRYKEIRLEEKNATIDLIRKGAKYRAILNPSTEKTEGANFSKADFRFNELLRILDPKSSIIDDIYSNHGDIEFVISPIKQNLMIIIDNSVCFEGRKSGIWLSYDVITRITDKILVSALSKSFMKLFSEAKKYTIKEYGKKLNNTSDSNLLRIAVYNGIKDLYEKFRANNT